jgi:hypothetical protein
MVMAFDECYVPLLR